MLKYQGICYETKPPGPTRSASTQKNVDRLRKAIQRSPARFDRHHAMELGLSNSTGKCTLHKDIEFHPYKILIVLEFNAADYQQRLTFSETVRICLKRMRNWRYWWVMKLNFHLNGVVNKHNCRYWAFENPCELHQRPLHSQKVTVWCAVEKCGVIGPLFLWREWNYCDC